MTIESLTVFIILFCSYFIRGVTGFGSGLIAVPLLAHTQSLQLAVPLVLTLDFLASFILGGVAGKQADWSEIRSLVPFGLIGACFGVFALVQFPAGPILIALSGFTIFFGTRYILGNKQEGAISRLWALPAGLVGSSAGALFGTSAPPYIIYLTHRLQDKSAVRATFSWLFVIDGGFRLSLFVATGPLLNRETQFAILLGILPMVGGLYMGHKVHLGISKETLQRFVGIVLVFSGASLFARAII